jgi:hypothetical protein
MSENEGGVRRPIGVTLTAIVQAVNAVTLGVEFAVIKDDPSTPYRLPGEPGVAAVFFVVLGLTSAAGLWTLQRWAWVATMLWAGLALLTSLINYYNGASVSYFSMAITLLQVFYLNLTEVQKAFEKTPRAEQGVG